MKLLLTSLCGVRKYPHFFWKSYETNKYTVPEKFRVSKDRPAAGGPLHSNHCTLMVTYFRYTHEIFRLRALTRFARIHSMFSQMRDWQRTFSSLELKCDVHYLGFQQQKHKDRSYLWMNINMKWLTNLFRIKLPTKRQGNIRCITNLNRNPTPTSFRSGYETILISVFAQKSVCVGKILFVFSTLCLFIRDLLCCWCIFAFLWLKYEFFQSYKQSCPCTENYSIEYKICHLHIVLFCRTVLNIWQCLRKWPILSYFIPNII